MDRELGPREVETDVLQGFCIDRILDEDPKQKSAILLGTIPSATGKDQAILILEKTHFSNRFYSQLSAAASREMSQAETSIIQSRTTETAGQASQASVFSCVKSLGQNDIYTWLLAWLTQKQNGEQADADVKLTLICPATQTHIDKYSAQMKVMVTETPIMYATKVLPWIESFPPSRIQWVYNILEHKKEADTILYENSCPNHGFIIVPDLKWDQKTGSSLYLQAIVHDRSLRSLRDLTVAHVDLLLGIREQASKVAYDKYGLQGKQEGTSEGNVRCFLHYQPSY